MSAAFKDLLDLGLEQAVQQHVCRLFDVLMASSNVHREEAIKNFEAGLDKLYELEAVAGVAIEDAKLTK